MKVLFACVRNSGRSQMAAAWFNRLADPAKGDAISAGTAPAERVQPEVVAAMEEVGIALAKVVPRLLTEDLARACDLLVTMGCGESCPFVPGLRRDDWPLADPKGQSIERVREIREEIRCRVEALVVREGLESLPLLDVREARREDLGAVEALLAAAELPLAGVAEHFARYRVLVEGDRVRGAAGLERYGTIGLLRSVVVAPSLRGRGHGALLVSRVVSEAAAFGVRELYLLTTTAPAYFERFGFARAERGAPPAELDASAELRGACPLSAVVMVKPLSPRT